MAKRQLYVTDWAPNGTNDLLVVEDGEVVACLSEATFGIDINRLSDSQMILDFGDFAAQVTLTKVSETLAVSPVLDTDDAEARVLAFLNANGVI